LAEATSVNVVSPKGISTLDTSSTWGSSDTGRLVVTTLDGATAPM
jgi:hypothetical protein